MFNHDCIETKTNEVEITDFDDETVKNFIDFLYNGRMMDGADWKIEMLEIANKYEVKYLKGMCQRELSRNLSKSNVVENLVKADQCKADGLKESAMNYILKWCDVSDVSDVSGLDELIRDHPLLAKQLIFYKNK